MNSTTAPRERATKRPTKVFRRENYGLFAGGQELGDIQPNKIVDRLVVLLLPHGVCASDGHGEFPTSYAEAEIEFDHGRLTLKQLPFG